MHALRHACASLWIENGMNAKRIQKLMGHSTIQMTFDVYGHLFTDGDARRSVRRRRYSIKAAREVAATPLQHEAAKSLI